MKVGQLWLSLPVKNLQRSKEFFTAIGFMPNPNHANMEHLSSFLIGENNFVMMLFPEQSFKGFARNEISDTGKGTEILLNIDVQSRSEVDRTAEVIVRAGGKIFAGPHESDGWMYACGFEDLDGHRWCVMHMDIEKMPENK